MLINLGSILRGETDVIDFDYKTDSPSDFDDISFKDEISVSGSVRNMAGYIRLELKADVPFSTHCARCWKEIDSVFSLDFVKSVAAKNVLQNEDNDDYVIIENDSVDIDTPLLEAITLNMPLTFLCKEDCKGLCTKCGKDLNEGKCSCPEKEIDPRLEILKKLLDN